ncbi:MAG: formate hydrogenlyase [Desulfitibacter sp. BRH_c19]|nr:MAG: formate hydrogenlyase [Desulfitibacter sp. BRH_c19]
MFQVTILLYLCAAVISLVLMKNHKLVNIVSNIICIAAALLGTAASIIQIISGHDVINLAIFDSQIPFISINLVIDHLSAFFVLGLSILVLCVSIYSIGYNSHYYDKRNVGLYNFLYATFILSMFLVITAGNAVFFFIAWETMAVLSYFLVVFESEQEENQRAGTLYIIMTHLGTAFLLIGFMVMFSYTHSFDIFGSSDAIPGFAKNIMFVLFLIGFGTKAGVIPFHIWLPSAHPAASSNVSALMSGIMIKTAIYGLIRFLLFYLHIQHTWWGILILCIGVVSAVLGIAYALMENNIKRLLAFSSIENIGVILIGLGVSFIAFAQNNLFLGGLALTASLFHTFNHTLFKGGLFLGAGAIQYSTHTKDMEQLGGLIKKLPVTAFFMLCFSLAISAVVPFNGFVSEWLTYQSLFANISPGQAGMNIVSILSITALALSGALAAACFVKLFGISFLGLPRSDYAVDVKKIPVTMNIGMGILATFCLAAGIFPIVFLKMVDKVALDLTGISIADQLQGGFFIAYYPLDISGSSISPISILIIVPLIILFAFLLMRLIGGKYVERKSGTWDCGFGKHNSRMQYSATGFTKPLRIIFRILYRPKREFEIEQGRSPYFPTSIKYKVSTEPIFEKYLYNPMLHFINNFSIKTKLSIQTGSIHMYLLYILVTVLALMLYNRLV